MNSRQLLSQRSDFRPLLIVLCIAFLPATKAARAADLLNLQKGDSICYLGNTLAERMQHDGWLETLIQSRFPRKELSFRNLGFSGDEFALRQRSAGFGSPHDHLEHNRADVVFAFFGYNESFAGKKGIKKFKADVGEFIQRTLEQKYNGETPPRLVIFSPIAHEDLRDPNLPYGRDNNARLRLYSEAAAQVCEAHDVIFVDLFMPTRKLYAETATAHTINGVHLNDYGNRKVAEIIDTALFGPRPPHDQAKLTQIRDAVLDKNFYWFQRYRVVDGYNVYGGRSHLEYNGQTNRVVMQREMEILDVMTANRDRRIWAVANGMDFEVDDSSTPEFLPTETNKPGDGPRGSHVYVGGEEAIALMTPAAGMKVNFVASEAEFPDLANPVNMAFDPKGRLFVACMPSYPHWKPKDPFNDKIVILEDLDGDGRADRLKVFADKLHVPTGLEFWGGGLFVGQQPDLMFLKDTDGDDVADIRQRVLHGIDSADTHHALNSFVLDPGGALYFQEGIFHHTQVETAWKAPARCVNAGVFRYEPRTQKFDVFVSYGFANPHGHAIDRWGQSFVTDGTSANTYFAAAFSGHVDFPRKHPRMRTVYDRRTRPCPATEILSSRHFPAANQGNFLVANVIGFLGILQYEFEDAGSGFGAKEVDPIVFSSDPSFRPADLEIGPDGAIWFIDWHNAIIGHMQHHLRDPSRDHKHGRVYRVTYEGGDSLKPVEIDAAPVPHLLDILKQHEDRVRLRARIELSDRKTTEVVAALTKWIAALDQSNPDYEHHLLEALWLHQSHNVVTVELLERLLSAKDARARAAATRVLCYWRDRVPAVLDYLRRLAVDPHPRVRLEAVRAASFFRDVSAIEVALTSLTLPMDYYLDYTLEETLRTLDPYWKHMLAEGKLPGGTALATRHLISRLSVEELMALRTMRPRDVYLELLTRPQLPAELRLEGSRGLAALDETSETSAIVRTLRQLESTDAESSALYDLAHLLTQRGSTELAAIRPELVSLATAATQPILRQIGFVTLMIADGSADPAYGIAAANVERLEDFVRAVPLLPDVDLRATLYNRLQPLLHGTPGNKERSAESIAQLRRAAITAITHVRGKETETFKTLASFVREGISRAESIRAVRRIPKAYWPAEEISPLVESVIAYTERIPASERTTPSAIEALQLGEELVALLPPTDRDQVRARLGDLSVRVIRLGTLPHQMLYDQETLVVEVGEQVEIVFENSDIMPHNLVLSAPGSLVEIGEASEKLATRPDALSRHYVPRSRKIIVSSRLLQPGMSQKLSFTAPTDVGVYPYVCTFPGHWRRMFGALFVVDDIDSYLADPEEYLIASEIKAVDPALESRRPRTEWILDDFSASLSELGHGRNFTNGKKMFEVAACVGCHRLNDVGAEFGPDLAKLDPMLKPLDVLHDMIEPSRKIHEKFISHTVVTSDGQVVTGLVVDESPAGLKIVENPLVTNAAREINVADIAVREPSTISIMPKGLLNKLTREEVLDLWAYVLAGGDQNHSAFQGPCGVKPSEQ